MYLEKLKTILKVPKQVYHIGNAQAWEEFQTTYNCNFPFDYKEFIDTYGTGGISNFLWILTPYEGDKNINLFDRAKVMCESYNYMKDSFPGEFNDSIYPEEGGLLPWGVTDNGDELFFGNGTVVVMEARYANRYEYDMGMIEFLYKLFMKEITCKAFPDGFINGAIEYNARNQW